MLEEWVRTDEIEQSRVEAGLIVYLTVYVTKNFNHAISGVKISQKLKFFYYV